MNLLPGSCGQGRASGQSDTRPTKGTVRVRDGAVQRSDGQARVDTDLIHSVTRECTTDAAGGLPMLWICHADAKAPHRLCASSPGSIWGFPESICIGKRMWFQMDITGSTQPADISELSDGVPGPFQPDPHRRGTVPVLCPLWGWQDSPAAWQRHGRSGGTGRLSA